MKGGFMKKGTLVEISKGIAFGIIVAIIFTFFMVITGYAGEKEGSSIEWTAQYKTMEWEAIMAKYNLALARFQQSSPEFKRLSDFAAKLDEKGFMFERDGKGDLTGKIIEKPKKATETADPKKK
jgi:hypothetical protein